MSAQTNVTFQVELTVFNCGLCGGTYAINERFREHCYQRGSGWHCPYCRESWGYYKNNLRTENENLKQANARLEKSLNARAAELQLAEHRERAQKAANTKLKKRLANGVCPCCARSFKDLAAHMKNKHADFTEAAP